MDLTQAIALALVQAVTEFLPISSSAHLVLIRWLLGWEDPGLFFDVALHFGTLLALAAYFGRTWVRILFTAAGKRIGNPPVRQGDKDIQEAPRLLWFLAAATLPAATVGVAYGDIVEATLRSPTVIGWMLVLVAMVIWWAERRGQLRWGLDQLSLGGAMVIGCAQALALVPGTSRAGITIAAALFLGLTREAAARFSFLLAMPVVAGATLKTAMDSVTNTQPLSVDAAPLVVGVVTSALAGYAVITVFLRYLQTSTMAPFVYYRLAFGTIVLFLASRTGTASLLPGGQ